MGFDLPIHLDELPLLYYISSTEVERAARLLRDIAKGKKIVNVDSNEDTIVFSGITHAEFVRSFTVMQAYRSYG